MGRYPIPTVIKIAQGTQRDDQSTPNEPTFDALSSDAPKWLDENGVAEWNRIHPLMKERGLATEADLITLSEWCKIISKLRYLETVTRNEDMVTDKNMAAGINRVVNPYEKLYDSYFDKMLKLCAKFGFTPADRTRINMPEPLKKEVGKDLIRRAI